MTSTGWVPLLVRTTFRSSPGLAVMVVMLYFIVSPAVRSISWGPAAAAAGPQEIDLTAGDTMKYNITTITAKPGEDLKVVLTNNGTQPVEVMAHNWVLLKAGTDVAAFDAAALTAKDTGYI